MIEAEYGLRPPVPESTPKLESLRILIVTCHRSLAGGAETYLESLLPHLREAGHELALVTEYPADPAYGDILSKVPATPAWVAADAAEALRLSVAWKPDVIYFHGTLNPETNVSLADRFPVVQFLHTYYGMCISGTKCQAIGPRPCTRTFGLACLALYFPRRCGGLNPVTMLRQYVLARSRLRSLCKAAALVASSRGMVAELARYGIPPHRIHRIPLFALGTPDRNPPAPRPRTGRVLFVGRLQRLKGWPELLEALPKAALALGRPLKLVVAGEGSDREAFEKEARRHDIATEFLGWVGAERRDAEMRNADVLAFPSIVPETFGLVGVEAGSVGLPTVAFAVGGIPDWLTAGEAGELAPGERPDASDFAAALVRALADDEHLQQLRVGAWNMARRFTVAAHVERLLEVFHAVARPGELKPN